MILIRHTLVRNTKAVVAGHLLQFTTPGKEYVADFVKIGHVRNHEIFDDRNARIIVSNRVKREFFA